MEATLTRRGLGGGHLEQEESRHVKLKVEVMQVKGRRRPWRPP